MDQTLPTNPSSPQPEAPQAPVQNPVTDPATQMPAAPVPPTPQPAAPAMPVEQPIAASQAPQPVSQPAPVSPEPTSEPTSPTPASTPAPAAIPPVPPTPVGTTPPAAQPVQPPKKSGMNMWVALLLIVLVALLGGGAYFLAKTQLSGQPVAQMPTPIPVMKKAPVTLIPSAPVASPTATITGAQTVGSVSGTLCYPAGGVPAGTIYAKDTKTGKEVTQAYKGTAAGESTAYSMSLPVGTYHMKFVPTLNSTTIGYYTEYSTCIDSPSEPNCSGTKARAILPVSVTANQVTPKVNLCDYYYPTATPPQY